MKKLAITMGDPSGIGAEVIIKSLKNRAARLPGFIPVIIGDIGVLTLNCKILHGSGNFIPIKEAELPTLQPIPDNSSTFSLPLISIWLTSSLVSCTLITVRLPVRT